MGLFDDIGEGLGMYYGGTIGGIYGAGAGGSYGEGVQHSDPNSAGFLYDVFDPFDFSGKKAGNARAGEFARQNALREQSKRQQLQLLSQRKGPQMTPQMTARLAALEQEGQKGPLVADPEFQGYRSNVVTGGRQALAGVQNRQAASGTQGGFSNVGSMQNTYDRVGNQLAQLGQAQNIRKGQKLDQAAQSRQSFADSQVEFDNAIIQAKMAIEAQDSAALSDAYSRMAAAKAQADQAQKAMVIGAAKSVAGAYTGNAGLAASGGSDFMGGMQQKDAPLAQPQQQEQEIPYASQNYWQDQYEAPKQYRPAYQLRGGR